MCTYLIIFETANLPTRTLQLGRPNSLYISQHPEIDALGFCGSNYILFFIKYECKMWHMPECYQLLWYVLASTSLTAGNFLLLFFSGTNRTLWNVYAPPWTHKVHVLPGKSKNRKNRTSGKVEAALITPVLSKGASGTEYIYLTDQIF